MSYLAELSKSGNKDARLHTRSALHVAYSYEAQGLEVSFYNISATAAPNDSYTWNLGNGVTITNSATPVFTYTETGTYNVCLTITADTCTASYCLHITLTDACTGFASGFSATSTGQLGYQFTDTASGNINEWLWGFGDGSISFEENPFHEYTQPGNYTVCLVAQDTLNNCPDIYCTELLVTGVENNFSPNAVLCLNIYPNPVSNKDTVIRALPKAMPKSLRHGKCLDYTGI